jgi:hypothetical protein
MPSKRSKPTLSRRHIVSPLSQITPLSSNICVHQKGTQQYITLNSHGYTAIYDANNLKRVFHFVTGDGYIQSIGDFTILAKKQEIVVYEKTQFKSQWKNCANKSQENRKFIIVGQYIMLLTNKDMQCWNWKSQGKAKEQDTYMDVYVSLYS